MTGSADGRTYPRSRTGFKGIKVASGILNHVDNISCSGILCHTLERIDIMTKMSIALDLPGPTGHVPIECEGIVVRCEPDGRNEGQFKVAILYTRLSDDHHQAIKEYVEYDLAQASAD